MKSQLRTSKQSVMLTVAAAGLAACAGGFGDGVSVSRSNVAQNYLPEELYVVATGENELKTVIVGAPFDMLERAFEDAVLQSMRGQNFGPPLNLSTAPKREDARKRQVVVAFNLADAKAGDNLCTSAANAPTSNAGSGRLTVTGVYCGGGGQPLTQATARAGGVTGTDAPQFRTLMSQLAIALFPDENPHRRLDDSIPPPQP